MDQDRRNDYIREGEEALADIPRDETDDFATYKAIKRAKGEYSNSFDPKSLFDEDDPYD